MDEVSKSLDAIHLPIAIRARPIPVATRGIGIACTIEYNKMTTTWSYSAISEICTIHQYYRVALYLFYSKCVDSRMTQVQSESFPLSSPQYLNGEIRFHLDPIGQMPICVATILSSIGRITVGNRIWHCFLPKPAPVRVENPEFCVLYLQPNCIRVVLETLSRNTAHVADFVTAFRVNCPIPGAEWNAAGSLVNADISGHATMALTNCGLIYQRSTH